MGVSPELISNVKAQLTCSLWTGVENEFVEGARGAGVQVEPVFSLQISPGSWEV